MIKINLAKILDEKGITQSRLAELTGIRPGTINAYYHQFIKRMNVSDINELCKVLNCSLNDLLEYISDK